MPFGIQGRLSYKVVVEKILQVEMLDVYSRKKSWEKELWIAGWFTMGLGRIREIFEHKMTAEVLNTLISE